MQCGGGFDDGEWAGTIDDLMILARRRNNFAVKNAMLPPLQD